jgi:hypothetical protein
MGIKKARYPYLTRDSGLYRQFWWALYGPLPAPAIPGQIIMAIIMLIMIAGIATVI